VEAEQEEIEMYFKYLILFVFAVSATGCTSMQALDMAEGGFTDYIETGDHIVVYEKDGRVLDMTVANVEDNVLYGSQTGAGWSTFEVELENVQKIEIEKISGVKTTGAVVGGLVLVPIFVAAVGLGLAAEMSY
jgi:hypothetical protein